MFNLSVQRSQTDEGLNLGSFGDVGHILNHTIVSGP